MNKKTLFSLLSLVALTTACGRTASSKSVQSSAPASSTSVQERTASKSSQSSESSKQVPSTKSSEAARSEQTPAEAKQKAKAPQQRSTAPASRSRAPQQRSTTPAPRSRASQQRPATPAPKSTTPGRQPAVNPNTTSKGSIAAQAAQLFFSRHPDAAITQIVGAPGRGNSPIIVFGGTTSASFKMVISPDLKTVRADTRIGKNDRVYNAHGIRHEQASRLDALSRMAEQSVGGGQSFKWILTCYRGTFAWKVIVKNGYRTHNVIIDESATRVLQSH